MGDLQPNPLGAGGTDRAKNFAQQLKALFKCTGYSTSQFEKAHGYANGALTRYHNGDVVPPSSYIDHLVQELRERSTFQPEAEQRLYHDYGELLRDLVSQQSVHPMHRAMYTAFFAQQQLRELADEHSAVVRELGQCRQDLEAAIQDRDAERERRLRDRVQQLQARENQLAVRRTGHLKQLDTARAELASYDTGRRPAEVADLATVHVHQAIPARPVLPPRRALLPADGSAEGGVPYAPPKAGMRRAWLVLAAGALIVALVIGFMVADALKNPGGSSGTTAQAPSAQPAESAENSTPSEPASTPPSAALSPEEDPFAVLDEQLTDVYEITVGDGNTLDVDGQRLNSSTTVDEFLLDFGRLFFDEHQETVDQDVSIGWIDNRDVPHCDSRARLDTSRVLHLSRGDQNQSLCVRTSADRWALMRVVDWEPSSSGLGVGDVRFRIGYIKN
ncbi:hypothetical protein ACFYN9_39770 [Streptomyces collinus]|uniref:hypothetical protein n=1 Tax=Streptomyces collinus TaxID=42684 RepID=UPI0036A92488